MWKGINGDVAGTLDTYYYFGCGSRGNVEREIVYWVDDDDERNKHRQRTVTHPLDCMHDAQAILIGRCDYVTGSIETGGDAMTSVVRRLTPLE